MYALDEQAYRDETNFPKLAGPTDQWCVPVQRADAIVNMLLHSAPSSG